MRLRRTSPARRRQAATAGAALPAEGGFTHCRRATTSTIACSAIPCPFLTSKTSHAHAHSRNQETSPCESPQTRRSPALPSSFLPMFSESACKVVGDSDVPLACACTSENVNGDHKEVGGDDGGRTRDLRNAIAALSQLSYVPITPSAHKPRRRAHVTGPHVVCQIRHGHRRRLDS
jgi:hypothetical protein